MGLNPASLPDRFLKCIRGTARERKGLPETFSEANARGQVQFEIKELHGPFSQWLNLNQIPYVHANPRKASTIRPGWPDYVCFGGSPLGIKALFIEFKTPTGRLSADQERVHGELWAAGCRVHIVTDLAAAIALVKSELLAKM